MNEKSDSFNQKIIEYPTCYKCDCRNNCSVGRPSRELENCPIKKSPDIQKKAIGLYEKDDFLKKSNIAATIANRQGIRPRLRDIIEYAKVMGFSKLGIASCGAFQTETSKAAEILNHYDFEVSSVCCATGINKKIDIEIPKELKVSSEMDFKFDHISCNPVAQALLLNGAKTEMNIIIGLCVGHDVTFTRLSEAPVVTLIVKDRLARYNSSETLNILYKEIK
jgi:uncharacterized metal-binding protein